MALAVAAVFVFTDDKGATATTRLRIPNGFSLAQYQEFAQGSAQVIADMSNCQVTRAGVSIGVDFNDGTLGLIAGLASDVYNKGRWIFNTVQAGFRKIMRIPSLHESNTAPSSNEIDGADPSVVAFEAAMEDGVATLEGTIQPVNERGYDITARASAVEQFRRK